MTPPGRKSCVVCSSSSVLAEEDTPGGVGQDDNVKLGGEACWSSFLSNGPFSRFCAELELCRSYGGYEDERPLFEAFKFLDALEESAEQFFLCGECLGVITEAMEKRTQLETEELEVWKLQVKILSQMNLVKECTHLYYKKMSKIFERVKASEIEVDFKTTGDSKGKMDMRELLCFREKIMDVVTYLAMFQEHLNTKLVLSNDTNQEHPCLKETKSQRKSSKTNPNSSEILKSQVTTTPVTEPGIIYNSSGTGFSDLEDFNDIPNSRPCTPENTEEREEATDLKPKSEPLSDPKNDSDHVETAHQDESEEEYKPPETKRRKRKRTRTTYTDQDMKEDTMESSPPKKSRRRKKLIPPNPTSGPKKKSKITLALEQIDFSGMSKFKRALVHSIVYRQSQTNPTDTPPSNADLAKFSAKDRWSYDPTTEKISVAGFEMSFSEDQDTVTVSCKSCHFQRSRNLSLDSNQATRTLQSKVLVIQTYAFDHVFLDHLKSFQCEVCLKQLKSLYSFQAHFHTHAKKPKLYRCDLCGKEYQQKGYLRHHMTLHESDQGKRFPCSVCGRAFSTTTMVAAHEETHKSLEERPHVTCPFCGQRMLKRGFKKHRRYYCAARKEDCAVICPICGNKFSSAKYVNEHIERKHGSENKGKVHKCEECGVGFKIEKDLITHQSIVHLNKDKKRKCRKGCGKEFILPFYQNKHEAKCEGGGAGGGGGGGVSSSDGVDKSEVS